MTPVDRTWIVPIATLLILGCGDSGRKDSIVIDPTTPPTQPSKAKPPKPPAPTEGDTEKP